MKSPGVFTPGLYLLIGPPWPGRDHFLADTPHCLFHLADFYPSEIEEKVEELHMRLVKRNLPALAFTNNPLVVNAMDTWPGRVLLMTSKEGELVLTKMTETIDFEKRKKVYKLGELWLTYATGEEHEPELVWGMRPAEDAEPDLASEPRKS